MLEDAFLNQVQDSRIKQLLQQMAHLLEQALVDNDLLRAEVRRLRDENDRLKGEHGKRDIKLSKITLNPSIDRSSEQKRKNVAIWSKSKKNEAIALDRTGILPLNVSDLPEYTVFTRRANRMSFLVRAARWE